MRISDWSSDVCSSDLITHGDPEQERPLTRADLAQDTPWNTYANAGLPPTPINHPGRASLAAVLQPEQNDFLYFVANRSEEHTSELQSLMRISYAVFCLKKQKKATTTQNNLLKSSRLHNIQKPSNAID